MILIKRKRRRWRRQIQGSACETVESSVTEFRTVNITAFLTMIYLRPAWCTTMEELGLALCLEVMMWR